MISRFHGGIDAAVKFVISKSGNSCFVPSAICCSSLAAQPQSKPILHTPLACIIAMTSQSYAKKMQQAEKKKEEKTVHGNPTGAPSANATGSPTLGEVYPA